MKPREKIEMAIRLIMEGFVGQKRIGPGGIPASTHSIRVGLMLVSAGYQIEVCLGGFFHDFKEDVRTLVEFIRKIFGERVYFLVSACSLNPDLEEDGSGEDELFSRVFAYAQNGDLDPLRIKCFDSLDNLRTNECLTKVEARKSAIEKGERWHRAARCFFPDELITYELGHMIEWMRSKLPQE